MSPSYLKTELSSFISDTIIMTFGIAKKQFEALRFFLFSCCRVVEDAFSKSVQIGIVVNVQCTFSLNGMIAFLFFFLFVVCYFKCIQCYNDMHVENKYHVIRFDSMII